MLKEHSNIDELHHFLGLTGYYNMFIPLFANITKPLNRQLKKDIKFQWLSQCQAAFEHLKKALCKEPIQYVHGLKHDITIAPNALLPTILHEFHDTKGHQGTIHTSQSIRRFYCCPKLWQDVVKYTGKCLRYFRTLFKSWRLATSYEIM